MQERQRINSKLDEIKNSFLETEMIQMDVDRFKVEQK